MKQIEVKFRLRRDNDTPATNPLHLQYEFGLQDAKQVIVAGSRQKDRTLIFDFALFAKEGSDPNYPIFTGRFANGPADDRFVYLSWRSVLRGDYINRVKARLSNIDWKIVKASLEEDKRITADMTGRGPGDKRKYVVWRLE